MRELRTLLDASTRPQRLAVEISFVGGDFPCLTQSFNEATAISCGDPFLPLLCYAEFERLQRGHSD